MEIEERQVPVNLMLIDDDAIEIELLESLLADKGYRVTAFQSGKQAVYEAASLNPDLILLDVMMPEMDGFQVCRRLKADDRTRHIPVIFVTAKNDKLNESKGFELGAVDYITKPIDSVVVHARIRMHLELKQHRDILESIVRKRTDELDKSKQQFQDLVEKALVGIAIVQQGHLVYQNPELRRILPDVADHIQSGDFSFIHPDDLDTLQQAYGALSCRTRNHVEAEFRIRAQSYGHNPDKVSWINCRASSFNYQGRDAILINMVDITRTKELEHLLMTRNKMSSLGRIASGMAHEIRNPLTGITSYLYTLEQLCDLQTLLPKDFELMKQIVNQLKLASHKMDAVIKRVLDFSRPTPPQMLRIKINQCIETVIHLAAVTMRKAGVRVSIKLSENLPACYGDAALIEQVIMNLIQNASRAVQALDREKIVAVSSSFKNDQITVSVSDSGPGVPNNLKEKIFDPFFTSSSEGTGIGLSIAQRIITDHNGSLSVHDSDLGGARFVVTLPVEKRNFRS